MIGKLRGLVEMTTEDGIIVDVNGVGYLVNLPSRDLDSAGRPGEEINLHIHTHVREDSIDLFGFRSRCDLRVFDLLLGVSGVGPRLALAILSTLDAATFSQAVGSGDVAVLTQVSGVGRKTAERLVLELQDKVGRIELSPVDLTAGDSSGSDVTEAVDALEALGYPRAESMRAVRKILEDMRRQGQETDVEELIRQGLRILSGEGGSA